MKYLIVAIVIAIALISLAILIRVKGIKYWLRYAVVEAEKELGSKTGKLKLEYVYNKAAKTFPIILFILPRKVFDKLVLTALKYLDEMLCNDDIKNKIK